MPVFNAPFSNTRSVAELMIAEIIVLSRHLGEQSATMHEGSGASRPIGAHEVRGKTLGIVGYGHIGRQLSVLAEALGMRVVFYDIAEQAADGQHPRAALARRRCSAEADFVTLHVDGRSENAGHDRRRPSSRG